MPRTRLSSKGQVVIPKALREERGWAPGTEFNVEVTRDGILLRPTPGSPGTTAREVMGCLDYRGPPRSPAEMDEGIARAIREKWGPRVRH
jgi:AbrB family looped-hinge helix DNA binding protein